MAEETLYCPSCNQKVRVPEEMLGQTVQCPLCNLVFTAPMRGAAPQMPPTVIPAGGPGFGSGQPLPTSRGRIMAPGIALIAFGALALFLGLIRIAEVLLTGREGIEKSLEMSRKITESLMPDARNQPMPISPEGMYVLVIVFASVALLMSLITLLGGIAMVRGRKYGLAVAGSILAMINLSCCCLGFPLGLWAIIVLLQPDVRASFS